MASKYRIISPLKLLVFFSVALASDFDPFLSPTEEKIENIRAETYQIAIKENFEIESLLSPVPIGIATMVDLMVMASTLDDFSLEAHPPRGGFKFVRHPESFHASLKQVSFAAQGAFLKAHLSMHRILHITKRMSTSVDVESIKVIFESGEGQDIIHFISEDLASIKEDAAQCSQLSKDIVERFNQVMELTEEVDLATISLKGGKEYLTTDQLKLLKLKKEESDKMIRELEENRKKMEAEAADAYKRASEAMDDMPGTAMTIVFHIMDMLLNKIFFSKSSDLVDKIYRNAESNLKAAQNELDRVRAEAKEARFQRKKEQEEQMKILTEIVKINFNDQNNYTTAIDTLTRGLNNLATLQQNWIRLQAFFGKVESFMEVNVVKSVEDLNKLTQKVLTGEMKITALMGKKIRIMTKNANEFSVTMYQIAGLFGKVSSNYIMKPLTEWSRIFNTVGKSKDAIEADREKLLELCIKAESGIKEAIENEEETFPAKDEL